MNQRRTAFDLRLATGRRRRPTQSVALESLERRDLLSADVLSYRYGATDQGLNSNETVLTPSNVNANDFGMLNTTPVDGQVYAQPLYKENVNITTGPSPGSHDVVFVATMHDSLYAIDAQSGQVLWQTSFIDPAAGVTTVPSGDVYPETPDISPEIGILSTPVIDPATNTLYAEATTKEIIGGQTHYIHRLHAIDLSDGTEKLGGPDVLGDTVLNADGSYQFVSGPAVNGTGPDSVNGVETFNAATQLQRAALSLVNGTVYVAFASYGDFSPFAYHGWILGVDAHNMTTVAAFNDTPNGTQGGIWQSGGGIASDASGNLYVSTGNGTFDATLDGNGFPAQQDYGDSVLKLAVDPNSSPTNQNGNGWGLKVVDYFSPYNTQLLDVDDTDLGSSGPILLPDSAGSADHPHLLLAGGKDGAIFLLDRDNLGKFNAQADQIVQGEFGLVDSEYGPAGYFNGNFYFTGINEDLKSFTVSNAAFTGPTAAAPDNYAFPGAISSISSNGNAGGIVWQVDHKTNELRAYDATDVTQELYTSDQAPAGRDQLGQAIKFSVPTVADGLVFVGTDGGLVTYGLLNSSPPQPTVQFSTASQSVKENAGTFSVTVSLSAASATDTTVPFTLGGTATSGTDYSGVTASPLVIPAGQTSGTITGTILDDGQTTPDRTIIFTLGTPTNATLGGTTSDTLTISETAAPPTVQFATASQSVKENAGTFSVTVSLSAASATDTTVPFTLGGTATSGTDYSGVTASPLVIPAGQTSGTITGTILDDGQTTPDRTIIFTLGTPTNATLGGTTSDTLTISETAAPPTVQFATASQSVKENAGTFSMTVSLSAASATDTTVPFTLGGTATSGTDYSGVTASPLVIRAGQTSGTITGSILDDGQTTPDRTIIFTLGTPTNATLGGTTSDTLTISETAAPPTVQFATASQSVKENAGTLSVTVSLSAASATDTTVPFTLGGTATSGTDYNGVTVSPLVIPAGQTSGTITGTILDDGQTTPDRTIIFTLGTPTNATLGGTTSDTLTISETAAPPTVQFATASQSVKENAGTFSVTVSLSAASATDTTVPFTLGGTATSGTDYGGVTASPLVIPAGQTSGTITGSILDDGQTTSDRTIIFTLGTPTNATLGGTTSDTLTISETAAPPTVQFGTASQSVKENAGTFSITVSLSAASATDTTVPFTLGGTATSGTDYSGVTASPLVIPAGQTSGTITGTILDDGQTTPDRTIIFTLGTPTNATLGGTTSDTLTISETAAPPTVQFATASQSVKENAGTFSVTVSLSAASATDTTVPFTLGGTATSGTDYSGITVSPLVIPAGHTSGTLTGTILDDGQTTPDRTIIFTLGTPTNATLGGTTSDTLTINEPAAPSIQGTGVKLVGNELSPLTGVTVATFTSGDGSESPGVFNATVNWGDGTTSQGAVTEVGTNYIVSGTHTYQDVRTYAIKVNVTGDPTAAAFTGSAVIHDALLPGITLRTPNQYYVAQAYVDLLDRPVDATGLANWSKALDQGLSRNTFTSDLTHSDEYLHNIVQSDYQRYLGRAADAQGLSTWTQQLRNGLTDEQIEADFVSSNEYFVRVGGTNKLWIDSVYFEMLGRAPDSAGENAWLHALAQGTSRNSVALDFAKSGERETERIQADYLRFLGRAASPAEVNAWVNGLMNGFLDEDVVAGFAASNEYYQLHSRPE